MININEKLLGEVDGNELLTLCHIAKRMNRNGSSFPSMETLRRETGLGRDAMAKVIRSLCAKGMLEKDQKRVKKGTFSSNLYTVTTRHISIFVNIHGAKISDEPDTDSPVTEKPSTATPATVEPVTGKQPTKYYNNSLEVLSSFEVLNTHTPAKIENENPAKTIPLKSQNHITPPVPAPPPVSNTGIDALSSQILSVIQEKTGGSETVLDTWRQRNPALTVDLLRKEIKEYARYYFKKIADTRVNEAGMSEETILSFRLDEVNRKLPSHFRADFAQIWLPRIGQRTGTPRPNSPKFETPRRELREL